MSSYTFIVCFVIAVTQEGISFSEQKQVIGKGKVILKKKSNSMFRYCQDILRYQNGKLKKVIYYIYLLR